MALWAGLGPVGGAWLRSATGFPFAQARWAGLRSVGGTTSWERNFYWLPPPELPRSCACLWRHLRARRPHERVRRLARGWWGASPRSARGASGAGAGAAAGWAALAPERPRGSVTPRAASAAGRPARPTPRAPGTSFWSCLLSCFHVVARDISCPLPTTVVPSSRAFLKSLQYAARNSTCHCVARVYFMCVCV